MQLFDETQWWLCCHEHVIHDGIQKFPRIPAASVSPHAKLCASSIDAKVGLSGGGECAYASTALPPHALHPIDAARAKNIRCAGCSTHEECVDAIPFNAGADLGDPSQQFRDLRVPSRLIWYCQ